MEFLYSTVGQCLGETARKDPDHIALEYDDWTMTFGELDRVSDLLAGRLARKYKIHKGMHVGIWSINTPSYVFAYFALVKIGAVPCVLNTFYKVEEISRILMQADIEILFFGAGNKGMIYDDMIPEIRRRAPICKHFVRIDEREAGVWLSEDSFEDFEKEAAVLEKVEQMKKEVDHQDPGCIIFTSGTTSEPKGVVLTHFSIINDVNHVKKYMRWTEKDKLILPVSLFHCFGLITGLIGMTVIGFTLHLIPYFGTKAVWKAISEKKCTVLVGVPSMFLALIAKEEYKDLDGSSLTSGIVGGSVLPAEDYLKMSKRFENMHLQTSFGMTEMSASVSFADWDEPVEKKAVTTGRLMEDIEGRIMDIQTGEIVDRHQIGEIHFRGFNMMQCYYNMPDKTAATITEDGWLRTGDIGFFNEDDELCITGRLKEMIIRSGENISPSEIEEVIVRSEMVDKVKVVGVPSEFFQEEVAACIVEKEGCPLDYDAFFKFLKPRLASFKVPQFVLRMDDLPMTASGKIDLKKIKVIAADMVASKDKDVYVRKD